MRPTRRAFLLGTAASLAGCGFHPLYGPVAGGGTVDPALASVYVDVIAERAGQELRQALQQRLEGTDSSVPKKFELIAGIGLNIEGIGIQRDTSSSRSRIAVNSTWRLNRFDLQHTELVSGSARATDGVDINDQQYFAADLETSAAVRRATETLADQIVTDLAVFFRAHPGLA